MEPETTEVTTVVVTPEPNNDEMVAETIEEAIQEVQDEQISLDHESRISALEVRLSALESSVVTTREETAGVVSAVVEAVQVANETADLALAVADDAAESAEEAAEAEPVIELEPEPEPEPDMAPESARTHPWFRSHADWSNK